MSVKDVIKSSVYESLGGGARSYQHIQFSGHFLWRRL